MPHDPTISMEEVIRRDGRYSPEAYRFLQEGLARATEATYGEEEPSRGQRHVTGQQICCALRDLAIEKWGMLAKAVLGRWNIHATIDFGNMVYLLIEHKFMKKSEFDSIEDFRDVYDLDEALEDAGKFEPKE